MSLLFINTISLKVGVKKASLRGRRWEEWMEPERFPRDVRENSQNSPIMPCVRRGACAEVCERWYRRAASAVLMPDGDGAAQRREAVWSKGKQEQRLYFPRWVPELSQSAELPRELSSSASFQFLLLFLALSSESESLWEASFRFLWSEVLSLSSLSLLSSELLSSSFLLIFAHLWFLHGLFLFFLLCLSFGAPVSSPLLKLSAFLRFSPSDFFFFFFFFFREDFFDRFGEPASDLDFFVLWRLVFTVGLSSLGKEEYREIRGKLYRLNRIGLINTLTNSRLHHVHIYWN